MDFGQLQFISWFSLWGYMTIWYFFSLYKKDASWVDIAWGGGFLVVDVAIWFTTKDPPFLFYITSLMVVIWALRLIIHLFLRKKGSPEDWRYQKWRKQWGKSYYWRSYLQIFLLQAGVLGIIAWPLLVSSLDRQSFALAWWQIVGVGIWAVGWVWETVADYQLSQFKKNKKSGQIMTKGLWAYSRHPNYFGEALVWWGIALVAFFDSSEIFVFLSPLLMNFLLIKVSGVNFLETKYADNQAYQEYKKRTNAFWPSFKS